MPDTRSALGCREKKELRSENLVGKGRAHVTTTGDFASRDRPYMCRNFRDPIFFSLHFIIERIINLQISFMP
jgi:hypothetical protein